MQIGRKRQKSPDVLTFNDGGQGTRRTMKGLEVNVGPLWTTEYGLISYKPLTTQLWVTGGGQSHFKSFVASLEKNVL